MTRYQYDALGRSSLITYPDGATSVGTTYDELGRMVQVLETNATSLFFKKVLLAFCEKTTQSAVNYRVPPM